MKIINVPEFNISSFAIGIPKKRHNDGYGSVLSYNGDDIIIQTPICRVEYIDTKEENQLCLSFKLSDNFEYFQFFCSLHELIIKHLCRYAENQQYDILINTKGEHEDIRKCYISSITKWNDTDMYLKLNILKKTQFFEKTKQQISNLEIQNGDYVVCIIKANQLSMHIDNASNSWDCIQCLRWKNKQ